MKTKITLVVLLFSTMLATTALAAGTAPKLYKITDHGAVGDGTTLNTKAIQATIDECAKKGGGTVVIPKGAFLSGAIFMKPGVNLDIQEGGVLRGSQNIEDYPKGPRRIEGHTEPWRCALINADKVDHLHITGKGMLDGNGEPFWKLFYSRRSADRNTTNLSVERPQLTFIQNSKDVVIQGITFHNSGFWNLHLYRDQQVTVDHCRFEAPSGKVPDNHAPSSDGIDVDSSQDITISFCSFSVGDDDIALKGSKGPFAMQDKDSPPDERIHIYDCTFEQGGGIMTCGSEATLVRDVDIRRCTTTGPTVLRLKLRPDTPQQYENISLDDITIAGPNVVILSIAPWTQYFDLKGQAPPTSLVRNIKLSNIKGTGGSIGKVAGNNGTTFEDITLKNINVTLKNADYDVSKFKTAILENVVINGTAVTTPAPAKQ
ncbi:glycosyl hydrolase family 28 protein [uncultured Mucilaginibacter sp.]|uniref:glycoside hydrolase family 28 protein n=1 Tax=uncultured Mucilaginibacter sp. TaxID=797541 RepID=UPI0025F817B6|nr:glycosyl hydrolase family 28 protein [uncultured Mucilaginibacter sp.]